MGNQSTVCCTQREDIVKVDKPLQGLFKDSMVYEENYDRRIFDPKIAIDASRLETPTRRKKRRKTKKKDSYMQKPNNSALFNKDSLTSISQDEFKIEVEIQKQKTSYK